MLPIKTQLILPADDPTSTALQQQMGEGGLQIAKSPGFPHHKGRQKQAAFETALSLYFSLPLNPFSTQFSEWTRGFSGAVEEKRW